MANPNAPKSEDFGSAANLMIEALDKASAELDKTVKACIEQLTNSNKVLEKSLRIQLLKVVEQSKNFIDTSVEDLTTHREELLDRLNEFERSEVETMMSAARDVRQQVAARGQQATESITRLVEEQLVELRILIENPEGRFTSFPVRNGDSLKRLVTESKVKVEQSGLALEQVLTTKAQEFDATVQQVISNTKKSIEESLEKYNGDMEEKIASVIGQLSDVVSQTITELEQESNKGCKKVEAAGELGKDKLTGRLHEWKQECTDLAENFQSSLSLEATSSQQNHEIKLERKVGEVKDEINHIAKDADAKIAASHKLFVSSLKRLEKKYNDRLERLLAKFESAMAEESRLPGGANGLVAHELKELLNTRLQARGKELLKSFQRQVDQLESEFARTSGGSNDRLEGIRTMSTESLDKQLRMMKTELDRIAKSFATELNALNSQLPQIEEAGRAAAMAVVAYKSAMLQFERD